MDTLISPKTETMERIHYFSKCQNRINFTDQEPQRISSRLHFCSEKLEENPSCLT